MRAVGTIIISQIWRYDTTQYQQQQATQQVNRFCSPHRQAWRHIQAIPQVIGRNLLELGGASSHYRQPYTVRHRQASAFSQSSMASKSLQGGLIEHLPLPLIDKCCSRLEPSSLACTSIPTVAGEAEAYLFPLQFFARGKYLFTLNAASFILTFNARPRLSMKGFPHGKHTVG
jgi:hypothetical protein